MLPRLRPSCPTATIASLATVFALATASPGRAARPVHAESVHSGGLHRVVFEVPEGIVGIHLPGDVAAGDAISGTVWLEPAGDSEKKRAKNRGKLLEHSLDLAGLEVPLTANAFRGRVACGEPRPRGAELPAPPIPPGATPRPESPARAEAPESGAGHTAGPTLTCRPAPAGGAPRLMIHLLDRRGRGRVATWVEPGVAPTERAGAAGDPGYVHTPLAQVGSPFVVEGRFDGDLGTTRLAFGPQPAQLLAESPRRLVATSPLGTLGLVPLHLEERGERWRGTVRNLAVLLAADGTDLRDGQRTALRIQVNGLEDLDEPLTLALVAAEPQHVRLENGVRQTFEIHPGEVQAGGVYLWVGTLVGVSPGGFGVSATVLDGGRLARLVRE